MNNMRNTSQPVSNAVPIAISKNIMIQNEQYSIKNICFDPTQNSPPSVWKMRLTKRLGNSPSPIRNQYKESYCS